MRILYSHRIQSRDGQSVHVEELVAALREAGHEVLVVGPGFYQHAGFGGESRIVARLRRLLPGALGEAAELAYNLPTYLRLRRAFRAFRPNLIYERYNLYHLAGAFLARHTGTPFYLEVNSPLAEERSRYGGLQLQRLARALERRVWRSADRVLAVTGVLKQTIAAAGVPAERICVVPNGIALDCYPEALIRNITEPNHFVLGFVGFVRFWHGLDAVLRAMAAQQSGRPIALCVVGDGPACPELKRLAAELGLGERVRFTGVVEPRCVPELVAGFDIALQPKAVAYASPLKIFDYMAAGRAIVAPDQPNIREILTHERTALLFDAEAPGAMWQAVLRLAGDAALRRRLGAAARAELQERDWTWHGNAGRIVRWAEADIRRRATGR
jgi:glycosyltransferase involved in cell wall biosynthesis